MATQFKSSTSYTGPADLADARYAGLRADQIADQYVDRVDTAGGVVADESRLRNMVRQLKNAGVLDKCRYFDAVDASWGAIEQDNTFRRAFSLGGGIDLTPTRVYFGNTVDPADNPGVELITNDPHPHWRTLSVPSNDHRIYTGLISSETTLPAGGYAVFGGTDRNLGDDRHCGVALGTRSDEDKRSNSDYYPTDLLAAPVMMEFNINTSWAYAAGQERKSPNQNNPDVGSGDPHTQLMFADETTGTYARFVDEPPDSLRSVAWYAFNSLISARERPVAIGVNNWNAGSWNSAAFGRRAHPSSFANFFLAVTSDQEVIKEIRRIMSS